MGSATIDGFSCLAPAEQIEKNDTRNNSYLSSSSSSSSGNGSSSSSSSSSSKC